MGECGVGLAAFYLASFWVLRSLRRSIFRSIGRTPEALACNHSMQYIIGRQRPSTTQWIVYTCRNKSGVILKVPSAYTSTISKWLTCCYCLCTNYWIYNSEKYFSCFLRFQDELLVKAWCVIVVSGVEVGIAASSYALAISTRGFALCCITTMMLSFRLVVDSSTHIWRLPF